jgi:hypothetical protein
MTDAEWSTCTDPQQMLHLLLDSGKATERKLRLFACACCRLLWHQLEDQRSRKAVMIAESFADGLTGRRSLEKAIGYASDALGYARSHYAAPEVHAACASAVALDAATAAFEALAQTALDGAPQAAQAELLRDLFVQRPVLVDPAWLAWNDGTVVQMARAIYADRTFRWMPVLADALEEAGCTDADLLAHCRRPGEHVPGCWLVDSLLGAK